MKPALVTTCIQRPPLFKDHSVMSQLWLYHAFLPLPPLIKDHFFWPKRGRLIQVSLYQRSCTLIIYRATPSQNTCAVSALRTYLCAYDAAWFGGEVSEGELVTLPGFWLDSGVVCQVLVLVDGEVCQTEC